MPGYLNSPTSGEPTIYHYVRKNGIADSRYLVNTLKAFFGDAATKENDYAYGWLPKRNAAKDYGTLPMFEDALAEKLKLLWIVGQNPAVTVPNLNLMLDAMAKLETLVVQEIWETETAAFWRRPGVDPKTISTEATRAAWCNGATPP
jgi:formate dehydrogenase major subunit